MLDVRLFDSFKHALTESFIDTVCPILMNNKTLRAEQNLLL